MVQIWWYVADTYQILLKDINGLEIELLLGSRFGINNSVPIAFTQVAGMKYITVGTSPASLSSFKDIDSVTVIMGVTCICVTQQGY